MDAYDLGALGNILPQSVRSSLPSSQGGLRRSLNHALLASGNKKRLAKECQGRDLCPRACVSIL